MAITLTQLNAFMAVIRCGSVTAAARELVVTQPSVSAAVGALERELGVELTERAGRTLRPTPAGLAFARYAADVLGLLEEGGRAAREAAEAERRSLRISAVTTAGEHLAPQLIQAFGERHPELELSLYVDNREQVFRHLADRVADVAITGRIPDDGRFAGHAFAENPIVLVTAPDDPLSKRRWVAVGELGSRSWMLREPGSGTRGRSARSTWRRTDSSRTCSRSARTAPSSRPPRPGWGWRCSRGRRSSSSSSSGCWPRWRLAVVSLCATGTWSTPRAGRSATRSRRSSSSATRPRPGWRSNGGPDEARGPLAEPGNGRGILDLMHAGRQLGFATLILLVLGASLALAGPGGGPATADPGAGSPSESGLDRRELTRISVASTPRVARRVERVRELQFDRVPRPEVVGSEFLNRLGLRELRRADALAGIAADDAVGRDHRPARARGGARGGVRVDRRPRRGGLRSEDRPALRRLRRGRRQPGPGRVRPRARARPRARGPALRPPRERGRRRRRRARRRSHWSRGRRPRR